MATSVRGQSQHILDLSGFSWETGGFPVSNVGDELNLLFIVEDVGDPLVWDTSNFSYSGYIRELVSLGEAQFGTTHIASYQAGLFTIYVDVYPGAGGTQPTYGIDPPNATAPSTFIDGVATYLDGHFTEFSVSFDEATSAGSFSGVLSFTGGDALHLLSDWEGWTFGASVADVVPDGYDLQVTAQVFLAAVAVEDASWGRIKNLYR